MATRNIVPRATGEGSIGTSAKTWGAGYFDDISVTNSLVGNVTGTASENLPLSGGTMTGALTINQNTVAPLTIQTVDSYRDIQCTDATNRIGLVRFNKDTTNSVNRMLLGVTPYGTNDAPAGIEITRNSSGTVTTSISGLDSIVVEQKTVSYTLVANGSDQKSVSVSKTGYVPIGIVGVQPNNTSVAIQSFLLSSNTAYARLKNLTATAIGSTNLAFHVLYIKS